MSNKNIHKIGYVNKCGGIPKFPNKYEFHLDEPVEFSENHIKLEENVWLNFWMNMDLNWLIEII